MRIRLFFAFLFALPLFFSSALAFQEINNITPREASELLKQAPEKITLLDVRTRKEYDDGHIEGAINADYLKNNFREELESLPPDKPLLMYCRSGQRTLGASRAAKDAGFKKIYVLEKGIEDWRKAGLPIVK
ncbi:MAG: rhodanese-like domain-containing protein [Desulfovibrio sp.]|nr:rhodanese-like domain-containing protein [Desulfovibrio sp.]